MKKLAMVLAMAFTMGLAVSTVSAATAGDEKPKKECTEAQKKSCASDKKACCSDKKASCSDKKSESKAEAPAKK